MSVYYNENDPYCCAWLQNLIDAGHLPAGDVDSRSIEDVQPEDLRGYSQCHFFAGIGGWPLALGLAGWGDRLVWTGSCPCQPFSAAGKGKASSDERHLWPVWFELIRAIRPATIFGEQVEAAIGWGWLDLVHSDLETEGYAIGATVLPACSVGAPHIRQRLWFVADSRHGDVYDRRELAGEAEGSEREIRNQRLRLDDRASGTTGELGHTESGDGEISILERGSQQAGSQSRGAGGFGFWSDLIWLPCTDGKQRPTQPGIFPLAHGVSARVGKLRAAGNAITPQVAAEFIRAAMP